jgi:hypothetical protein
VSRNSGFSLWSVGGRHDLGSPELQSQAAFCGGRCNRPGETGRGSRLRPPLVNLPLLVHPVWRA